MLKKVLVRKLNQLLLHTLFWAAVLLFYTSFFGVGTSDFGYVLSFSLFLMPITIATTYVFIYKIIPDYLVPKRYWLFAFYSTCAVIISAYLIVVSVFFALVYLSNFQYSDMIPISKSLLFVSISVYLVVITVSAFKLLKFNFDQRKRTEELESVVLETKLKLKEQELSYLKMQIHPHFLFNTLNTLYGFALKKADSTPEMILKLSNLLDYILYKVDQPFVLLKEEVSHIRDYIELEKMRFNDTLNVEFEMGDAPETLQVPPMLLIPFVENSFKHGALRANKLSIKMKLICDAQFIHFYLENSVKESVPSAGGIGLENIKKRLDLLYKDNYDLDIEKSDELFKVNLRLAIDNK